MVFYMNACVICLQVARFYASKLQHSIFPPFKSMCNKLRNFSRQAAWLKVEKASSLSKQLRAHNTHNEPA